WCRSHPCRPATADPSGLRPDGFLGIFQGLPTRSLLQRQGRAAALSLTWPRYRGAQQGGHLRKECEWGKGSSYGDLDGNRWTAAPGNFRSNLKASTVVCDPKMQRTVGDRK